MQMQAGRDLWWHELMAEASADCPATPLDSEAPLFILYTSGSTGKPKGIKHTTAGYNLFVKKTFQWVFDYRDEDIFWCTADCGWVTGHSYIVYGPLSAGATVLMYEGAPNSPDEGRFWDIIEKYRVNILYTAPTAIRAFIKWGDQHVDKHDLSSLRLLGTVGEGINPEAWMWYHRKIGGERCPIVDTWWQTETGGIMMSPLPGAIATKPGSCTKPLPGIVPAIVDEAASRSRKNQGGLLFITQALARHAPRHLGRRRALQGSSIGRRCRGNYLTGDNARRDNDGYYWIMGRIDDVINVTGHRLSTIEVESALVSHPARRRSRRRRPPRRAERRSRRRVRHAQERRAERRAARRAEEARPQRNRRPRRARRHPLHRRAAQNPQRQNHAPPAPRHRRRQRNGRRHEHAGRLQRAGEAARGRRVGPGLLIFLAEFGQDAVIFERRGVADGFFAGGDVAQQPAHDFAAAGLGQGAGEADVVGLGQRADFVADVLLELLAQRVVRLAAA